MRMYVAFCNWIFFEKLSHNFLNNYRDHFWLSEKLIEVSARTDSSSHRIGGFTLTPKTCY
jgi:hypothetical protein